MTIDIYTNPKGEKISLTTDHSASSYGIPVMTALGEAWGPGDQVAPGVLAADLVSYYLKTQERDWTREELALFGLFFQQHGGAPVRTQASE